jgi:hypothetical protein
MLFNGLNRQLVDIKLNQRSRTPIKTNNLAINWECIPVPTIGKHHFYKADWEELDISTSKIQRRLIEAA